MVDLQPKKIMANHTAIISQLSDDHKWLSVSESHFEIVESAFPIEFTHTSYFTPATLWRSKRAHNLKFNFSFIASGTILTRFSPQHIKLHFITCAFHQMCAHSQLACRKLLDFDSGWKSRKNEPHTQNGCNQIENEKLTVVHAVSVEWAANLIPQLKVTQSCSLFFNFSE